MARIYDIADYESRREPNKDKKRGLAEVFDISNHIRWQGKHEMPPDAPIVPVSFVP